ncbi:MAG: type II toxin-antitoxin system YafQ family toxin [Thiolinea sp.]
MPRITDYTKAFQKDWQRLSHSGRYNMKLLKELMLLLIANDDPLGEEWLDHALTGNWDDHRECHVGGDFLLIYRLEKKGKQEMIVFVRAGTHSELFG